jgi:hypothetical protein
MLNECTFENAGLLEFVGFDAADEVGCFALQIAHEGSDRDFELCASGRCSLQGRPLWIP